MVIVAYCQEKKDDIVIQKEAPKEVVAEKEEPQKTDKQEPAPIKKEVVLIPKEEKEIKKTPVISNGNRLSKGAVDLPSYFVACSAVKTEALAINKTNQLTTLGFKSSYYWIPDFTPNGNTYFKVVVGPFKDRREAMRNLTRVQERVEFDAYVYELK